MADARTACYRPGRAGHAHRRRHPLRPGLGRDHRTGRRRGLLRRRAASRQLHHLFAGRRPDHGRRTADPDRPVGRRRDRRRFRRSLRRSARRRAAIRSPRARPAIADRRHPDRPRGRALQSSLPGRGLLLRGLLRQSHAAVGNPRPPHHPRRGGTAALFRGRAVPRHGRAGHLATADAPSRPDAGARHGLSGALDPRHRHHGHADPRSLLHHAGRSRRPDADAMDRAWRQPDDRVALPPGFSQGRDRGHGLAHLGRPDRRRHPRPCLRRRHLRYRPQHRSELPVRKRDR